MPLRSNVVSRSSISSEECTSAGSESFTSSYSRYPRPLPMAMSCRTASYFSSKPVAATAFPPLLNRVSRDSRELPHVVPRIVHTKCREIARQWAKERIPRKTLNFFGEALCAVLSVWYCCTLARLPRRRGSSPCSPDIHIDAGIHESVIRATLLRYTLKSHSVNVLLCGIPSKPVDYGSTCSPRNSLANKPLSGLGLAAPRYGMQSFHKRGSNAPWPVSFPRRRHLHRSHPRRARRLDAHVRVLKNQAHFRSHPKICGRHQKRLRVRLALLIFARTHQRFKPPQQVYDGQRFNHRFPRAARHDGKRNLIVLLLNVLQNFGDRLQLRHEFVIQIFLPMLQFLHRHLQPAFPIQRRNYFRHRHSAPLIEQLFLKIALPFAQRFLPRQVMQRHRIHNRPVAIKQIRPEFPFRYLQSH